jgi:hypothetical protein
VKIGTMWAALILGFITAMLLVGWMIHMIQKAH